MPSAGRLLATLGIEKYIMETLKANQICSFLHDSKDMVCGKSAGLPVSSKPGHEVTSYVELLEKVASLNYHNPSLKLFFRGQSEDYFNYTSDGRPVRSSLYPSILRRLPVNKNERLKVIKERLSLLRQADSVFKKNPCRIHSSSYAGEVGNTSTLRGMPHPASGSYRLPSGCA